MREEVPNCLGGLYNSTSTAKHNATVKSLTSPGERPQEIYTPQYIVDAILKVWGTVQFDPCWGPGSLVPSLTHAYVPPRYEIPAVGKPKLVFRAAEDEEDGLVVAWPDRTYVNPPFKFLKAWMAKARSEARSGAEIMLLCPVRPHRVWWRQTHVEASAVCYLNPVKFEGYKSTFPQPMCLMYFGAMGHLFEAAFAELGDCL